MMVFCLVYRLRKEINEKRFPSSTADLSSMTVKRKKSKRFQTLSSSKAESRDASCKHVKKKRKKVEAQSLPIKSELSDEE